MTTIQNYIGGRFQPAVSNGWLDDFQPATGRVFARMPDSDAADVSLAVEAAKKAWPDWQQIGPEARSRYMAAIAGSIEARIDDFARVESMDSGKPLNLARTVDIPRAIANFRFFSTAAVQFASESHAMEGRAINYTLRQPLGVVGCISPWNLPLYLFTWKIAPALAAGNCVVAKPSELTPMTAWLLARAAQDSGMPAGVLNILHGLGARVGHAIVEHPEIKAISFTGGTQTGRIIARTAAPMFKKLSLELGGKNPNIIFADCDFEQMMDTTVRSSFSNNGQICLCGSRIYVEKSLYERFRDEFVRRTRQLKVGDPMDPSTNQGALVSQQHLEKVSSYLALAQEEGGRILCGGEKLQLPGDLQGGYFISPAVVEGLGQHCRCNQEEIFGPVVTIQPFESEPEALALANSTDYGLAATLWTGNLNRAHRMAEQIQSGIVWVNCWMLRDLRTPFGGMKNSGVGREGGWEAMRFFTEPKNVCIRYGENP